MKKRQDIREELKNIAPKLGELNPTNPFDVPQGYFELLPNEVVSKIKKQNELVESLGQDESKNSTNPFDVPRNYFDALPNVVMERVKSEPKIIELSPSRWKNWLSIAAAVAAILLMAIPLLKPGNIKQTQTTEVVTTESFKEVSNDELYSYLSEDVNVWHAEEVAAGLSDSKLDTLEYELVTASVSYDDALLDLSQIDIESLDIESL